MSMSMNKLQAFQVMMSSLLEIQDNKRREYFVCILILRRIK